MKKNATLTKRARFLRKRQTEAEGQLWYLLRNRNFNRYRFKRQYPIPPYIVDFICHWKKLIIEVDGGQHYEAKQYDDKRTKYLESKGYHVLRFWNNQVLGETDNVMEVILRYLEGDTPPPPSPCPSPATTSHNNATPRAGEETC